MHWPSVKIGSRILRFGLVQHFVVAAGITIAASMALLSLAISQRTEASMMQTAADEDALFTEVFLGPLAQELATSRSLSPESVKKLDDLLAGRLGQRLKLIKIWLPDATLVYSTNKENHRRQISLISHNRGSRRQGDWRVRLSGRRRKCYRGRLHVPLVEIYAPLFRTGTQEIIAVGEVYTDGRRLAADLASIRLTFPSGSWRGHRCR